MVCVVRVRVWIRARVRVSWIATMHPRRHPPYDNITRKASAIKLRNQTGTIRKSSSSQHVGWHAQRAYSVQGSV